MTRSTFWTILAFAMMAVSAMAELPTIVSNEALVSVRNGAQFSQNSWRVTPELNPDVYTAALIDGKPSLVTFISDADSLSFVVEMGKSYDFVIMWNDQPCHTRIVGELFVPAAVFDQAYQDANRGKILAEIPPVYELVNVAIALTSFGQQGRNFIYHDSQYHAQVQDWFANYTNHPFVARLDSLLTNNSNLYNRLKMNGASFVFDSGGNIVQSPIYDRTGFANDRTNRLRPHLDLMRDFATESDFLTFYRNHADTYAGFIGFFHDTADISEMKNWLDERFPQASVYDLYKIIFSPLVSYNQSSTRFQSNGFNELQPHVNFPYVRDANPDGKMSPTAEAIYRGNIVFTEINHGYLYVPSSRHVTAIAAATSNRYHWVESEKGSSYYPGNSLFEEYMNWGLVTLRIMDYVPIDEQEGLIDRVVRMMKRNRSFSQFDVFNAFLTDRYANRKTGETIADMYPDIIAWFAQNN